MNATAIFRRHKWLWAVVLLVLLLMAARVALPSIVKDTVNQKLMALPAYDGHVNDVDLALWRGAYRIEGIRIVKTGSKEPKPFFDGDRIDFSVEWRSLLKGSLVSECEMRGPRVNLVHADTEEQSQLGEGVNWADGLERLFPFRFNTIQVVDGTMTFRAPGIRTQDALEASHVNGAITNMTNVVESGKPTFAGFGATAEVLDTGKAKIDGSANPLAATPTFDVNISVKNVQLPKVNPWLRQYIKADAESGEFELYTELAAANGKFKGYAKPIMRNVNIYSSEEQEENPLKRLWEGLVEFAAEIFEDQDTGQVAARIPFSGTIKPGRRHPGDGGQRRAQRLREFFCALARGQRHARDVKKELKKIGDEDEEPKENKEKKK